MTYGDAKQQLALKLDINLDDIANNGLWSNADLTNLLISVVPKAYDYKPWPFTQTGRQYSTSPNIDAYNFPTDIVEESTSLLQVGPPSALKEFKKLNIQDYLKWLEDNPNATDCIWSEASESVYINKNAYNPGTDVYVIWGKQRLAAYGSDDQLLPFTSGATDNFYSGNDAIVQLAFAEALLTEKKNDPARARIIRADAYAILDNLWEQFAQGQALLQSKNRPIFTAPDFFRGRQPSSTSQIGNFNQN